MYNYSRLPTLVLNEIFGYLSVKEQIKCKSVCRSWRQEIELRETKRDTLVLHLGAYLWNIRWSQTANGKLIKYENSFEVKQLTFLKHSLTRRLLEKTKKLAIVNYHKNFFDPRIMISNVHPYIDHFKACVEIEIRSFELKGVLLFDLPKLKTLTIKDCLIDKLVLNCPSLESLFCNWTAKEIQFQTAKKLKRFVCFGCPVKVSHGKFASLEYLNLFVANGERVSDRLLDQMPKLERLVLYSRNPLADLKSVREQQERCGLKQLDIRIAGFSEPVEIALEGDVTGTVKLDLCVDQLFDGYAKLVENSPWKACLDYSALFDKFKLLPSNFVERFREASVIEISSVASYTHLFEFIRCYPFVQQLRIHFSKVKANLILDQMHLLAPALRELTIVEQHSLDVLNIDLSFMYLFDMVYVKLESNRLPAEFIRRVAAKRGKHFSGIEFEQSPSGHQMAIYFVPGGLVLVDISCGPTNFNFASVEQLISGMRNDRHLKTFLM